MIRISGPAALDVADRVLRLAGGKRLAGEPPRTVHYGKAIAADGGEIDEVIAFAFHAPRSYTREDLVEIQAHGGTVVLRRLLRAVLDAGAALAEPGEFTERAVINGRLTLAQAEAVLDLIRAKTDAAAAAAARRLAGAGGQELLAVEREVLSMLAEVEAGLDFPEDVSEPGRDILRHRAEAILTKLDAMLAAGKSGRLLTEGAQIAIAGRPNVGKSSLLNALLGEERAIVTDVPGTTRDAVAEEISLGGIPVRLVDTAGLGTAGDELEALGMARTRGEIARADLVLLVLAGDEPLTEGDEAAAAEAAARGLGVIAVNKSDLPAGLHGVPEAVRAWPAVRVSARTGFGLVELKETIVRMLGGRVGEGTPLLSHLRQIEAAQLAREALREFAVGLTRPQPWEILAEDLRACLAALGRLTGRAVGPEVLREVFSRFCIGK